MPIEKINDFSAEKPAAPASAPRPARRKKPFNPNVVAVIAIIVACVSVGVSIYFFNESRRPITWLESGADGNSATFAEGSIEDVANKVSASVVSITTEVRTTSFWGQSSTSTAAGTGVIVSADGYILTNKHVISDATTISVILEDGTTYENVKLAATDALNDIAFLKIDGVSNLPAATLGNSKTINVGQQVIAIGNALGQYQNTVTSGIISGTGRTIVATDSTGYNSETLTDMIQTDAAINAGNSGGPLVNAAGEVIGINTAVSSSGEGLGFAIPISSVKGMLKSLIKNGTAERAYIGVTYVSITASVAKEFNLPVSRGAYVYAQSGSAIVEDGPADKAGLEDEDIITAVNNVEVGAAGSVSTLIAEYEVGDTVQLTILRDGEEMAIKVTLEAYKTTTKSTKKSSSR